jgi:hypothetical protein
LSQYNFGNLSSPLSGTALVDTHLEPWRDALHTMHSGSSRPSYAAAGIMWLDTTTTPWVVKVFDGADDISMGTVNATTNLFAAANAAQSSNPVLSGTISGSAAMKINNFRLTLTTGVPVTTTDVTGASTLYLTPYNGNQIALYNGTAWELLTTAQVSLALSGLTANRPYDVFAFNNAGTVTLEILAWTSDTARATALAYQDGVLVRSGSTTRRYLGTFYSTGTTTTEDSVSRRYVWNYYNRVTRNMSAVDTTSSWTYTTATWRAANANTTAGQGRVLCVVGVAEDAATALRAAISGNTNNGQQACGIGINSTSSNSAQTVQFHTATNIISTNAQYTATLPIGLNFIQSLEWSQAAGTTTWYGGFIAGVSASGLIATLPM